MPIPTGFGSIDQDALTSVLGGCGKKCSQQQSFAPTIINQMPPAPPPAPIAAAPAPSGDSINTSVQIAGY
jgi:hypothetical protein